MKYRMTMLVALMAVAVGAIPLSFGGSDVHFALSKSMPLADSSIESPAEIRLWFTEVPDAGTTSIRLIGADEQLIHTGDVTQDEKDRQSFSVALESALSSGTYTVAWRAMGADGHVVRDDYEFTVVAQ